MKLVLLGWLLLFTTIYAWYSLVKWVDKSKDEEERKKRADWYKVLFVYTLLFIFPAVMALLTSASPNLDKETELKAQEWRRKKAIHKLQMENFKKAEELGY